MGSVSVSALTLAVSFYNTDSVVTHNANSSGAN